MFYDEYTPCQGGCCHCPVSASTGTQRCTHHAKGGVAIVQYRRPLEHKDVHIGLEQRLDDAQEENLLPVQDGSQAVYGGELGRVAGVAVVLRPRAGDHDRRTAQKESFQFKVPDASKLVF